MSGARRRSLRGCERGAMYVEALVMIPVLVTLWTILLFLERGNTVDNETVERSRYCAWRYAANECRGGAPCQVAGLGEVPGGEIDMLSGGALTTLGTRLPFLAPEMMRPHGALFRATATDHLARPFDWGGVSVASHQAWMCQTERGAWTTQTVFLATCQAKGLRWCSVGLGGLPF
jgi:hypothetical protein